MPKNLKVVNGVKYAEIDMLGEISKLLDQKLDAATEEFGKRLNELFKEYDAGKSIDEKKEIIRKITQLSRAFEGLQSGYERAKETFAYDHRTHVEKYDEWFEAKLQDKPHEWD